MPDAEGHPDIDEITLGPLLSALADDHRRLVIMTLLQQPDGTERTCLSFDLPVGKSTLTHHFRVLREAGLVRQIDRGNSRKVQLRRADLDMRFPHLLQMLTAESNTLTSVHRLSPGT